MQVTDVRGTSSVKLEKHSYSRHMLMLWSVLDICISFQNAYKRRSYKMRICIRNYVVCMKANSYQCGNAVGVNRG